MVETTSPDLASDATPPRHVRITEPSPWVVRFAPLVPAGGRVLDLACGAGRHARLFLERGCPVVAIDRDVRWVADLADRADAEVIEADLEGGPDPYGRGGALTGRRFACVLVSNYLHRPLLPHLVEAVEPGGVFLYETFARGNEQFTRPRNPDHLLESGELLALVRDRFQVIAYEHGIIEKYPCSGVIQRLCAVRDDAIRNLFP